MALNFELEVLDEMISENLHLKNLIDKKSRITSTQVTNWLDKALAAKRKARKRFKPVTYSFPEEKHRQLYIRQHQTVLIRLLDTLYGYLSPFKESGMAEHAADSNLERLYKRLYAYCLKLLTYLHDNFPEYFNPDHKLPDFELLKLQHQWKERLSVVQKRLPSLKTDKRMSILLVAKLSAIFNHTNDINLTYRSQAYIHKLLLELESLRVIKTETGFRHPLILLLIQLNFNETAFKDYLADDICTAVNELKTSKEKIERLSFYYKEFANMHTKAGMALYTDITSVKDDMKTWLAREIKYLEKSKNLGIIVPARFADDPQYKRGIWYTYTIQELALLQRIQHDAGFITNSNIVGMMEDLSKIAHTATQHNISFKNLKNLFYNVELGTIDSMHNKLLLLIRKLQDLKAGIVKKEKEKRTKNKY